MEPPPAAHLTSGPLEKRACAGCLLMFSRGLDCGHLCEGHLPILASCPASAAHLIPGLLSVSHNLLAVNYNRSLAWKWETRVLGPALPPPAWATSEP